MKQSLVLLLIAVCFLGTAPILLAQEVPATRNYVVPQSRIYVSSRISALSQPVILKKIAADVAIIEQVATTTLDFEIHNPNNRWVESELLIPVPGGAILKGFSFEGQAKEPAVKILPKDEAKKIYTAIVMKMKDPGLLEFVGYNLIKSSVFPIAANQTQKVRIVFENLLKAYGDRIDYFIPRTESLQYKIPWEINVSIKSKRNISTVFSPSHKLEIKRVSNTFVTMTLAKGAQNIVGPFMLSYLLEKAGVTASLFAYPDPSVHGGYFLMLAGLPADLKSDKTKKIKREVILVLDRSGSMSGNKIEQAREAAIQVIGGLQDGESFNIITYNDVINLYSEKPVIKSKETQDSAFKFLKTITATSGTNIHDALLEALKQKPQDGFLPIVLFLTDGQPTTGNTSEIDICKVATNSNPYSRRIFSFGVGYNVNAPLLEKISNETRAIPTFVLPNEDVEVKVGTVFKRLKGPVMTDINLMITTGDDIQSNIKRAFDVYPSKMPDLYEGDQLVVLGKYLGDRPIVFNLIGNYLGEKK
ncbi:MAG: VWA domain-containing protein, partial [Planctomycetes bacterium]|nr:VWA domain-containing protein [Planctomycetota bacterium]